MISKRILTLVLAVGAGAITPSAVAAQSAGRNRTRVPPVPVEIQVPAGHAAYASGFAVGTQNYICATTASGTLDWTFIGPQATLFITAHGEPVQQRMTHYLSQNPFEVEKFRATWQHSVDSSRVWGVAVASSEDPAFVEPGAIPWLLLDVVGGDEGPTGGRTLSQASLIHRLNTSGGRKPIGGCTSASHIGTFRFVPYSAEYYFYRAR
jgi:hypothetical protein